MNLISLAGWLGNFVNDTWMSIWLSLNDLVYSVIGMLYQVFISVANVNLFSEEAFNQITSRIYIIMGIAMLFIFAYNLILMIINPDDKKGTGQTTKVVKETIISLILVILLPTIFRYMHIFQQHVLNSGIISQIILGDTGGNTDDCGVLAGLSVINDSVAKKNDEGLDWNGAAFIGGALGGGLAGSFGGPVGTLVGAVSGGIAAVVGQDLFFYDGSEDIARTEVLSKSCETYNKLPDHVRGAFSIAPTIFSAFYHPTKYGFYECYDYLVKYDNDSSYTTKVINDEDDRIMCSYYVYDTLMSKYTGNIKPFNNESKFYSEVKAGEGTFEFNYLLAFIAGIFAIYIFVCYTIAIGTRVAKLGFLQIISPIAVMMRIIPKQKEAIFDKWYKELLNTYIDVFIRLMIIFFALFAISLVPDVIASLFKTIDSSGSFIISSLSMVVVILGILKFAQEAPELFKQFFGANGKFALKSPKKQLSENKLAMGAMGMARGGFGSASRNMFRSIRDAQKNGGVAKNIGSVIGSTIGGFAGGAKRGAKAGYGSTLDNIGMNTDRAIDETTDKRRERAKYKALHGGKLRGVMKGHISDSLDAAAVWTGVDGGRDIIDTIKYEESVINHYDDYESMYKSGGYAAKDERLKEMKAAHDAKQGYDGIAAGRDLQAAIDNLEKEMQQTRIDAIKKNVQNAAYVAYEFSQSLHSDTAELERIRDKLKLSNDQMEQLKGLQIKNNKVVDSEGNAVSQDLVIKLLEGENSIEYIDGKIIATGNKGGLGDSSGALKGQLSADKLSVAYKHQSKLEQERKDKK